MEKGFQKQIFGCYVCYYLHNGFKISMLLGYNFLLLITILHSCEYIYVFKLYDFIPCFKQKYAFIIIEKYEVVAIFK